MDILQKFNVLILAGHVIHDFLWQETREQLVQLED